MKPLTIKVVIKLKLRNIQNTKVFDVTVLHKIYLVNVAFLHYKLVFVSFIKRSLILVENKSPCCLYNTKVLFFGIVEETTDE